MFLDPVDIRFGVVDKVIENAQSQLTGRETDILLLVLEDHVVDAALTGRTSLTAADFGTGQILQFQRYVFHHVAHPGAFTHTLQEAARAAE